MYNQEIEIIKALANGVNYFTGEKCANDSILNDPNIVRVLFRVCDILSDVKAERIKKSDFVCPSDIIEKFAYQDKMTISQIAECIADIYPNMKKFKTKSVYDILIQRGLLQVVTDQQGRTRRVATEKAKGYGIFNEDRFSQYGNYRVVVYNTQGQRYVLSLLKELSKDVF